MLSSVVSGVVSGTGSGLGNSDNASVGGLASQVDYDDGRSYDAAVSQLYLFSYFDYCM